jgi:hypothetical protein
VETFHGGDIPRDALRRESGLAEQPDELRDMLLFNGIEIDDPCRFQENGIPVDVMFVRFDGIAGKTLLELQESGNTIVCRTSFQVDLLNGALKTFIGRFLPHGRPFRFGCVR